MSVVTIVGAGMMGSALAFPARENGNEVRLVGTHLDKEIIASCIKNNRHLKFERDFPLGVKFYYVEDLSKALCGADLVIGGVSSFGVDWFADNVLPLIKENTAVLTVTKGLCDLEDGRLICYPDIWEAKLESLHKKLYLNAVGGPCTSYELVAHDQTAVVFCGKERDVLEKIRGIMKTDYYHIELSDDVIGIESAVALKNGYALAVALTIGINQKNMGMDLHYNSQAAVFMQASKEMSKLLKIQGAAEESLYTGIGDLYVTVYGGRTRLVGILLGKGLTMEEALKELKGVTLESLVVAKRVARAVRKKAEFGLINPKEFPLLFAVDDIVSEGKSAYIPWDKFAER